MNRDTQLLNCIQLLCTETEGKRGIWKRIDENRELLEFMQQNASKLMARCPFIEGWIGNQDIFLVNLLQILELPGYPPGFGNRFPRQWPGNPRIGKAYMDFTPAIAAMMALPVAETPSGKDSAP